MRSPVSLLPTVLVADGGTLCAAPVSISAAVSWAERAASGLVSVVWLACCVPTFAEQWHLRHLHVGCASAGAFVHIKISCLPFNKTLTPSLPQPFLLGGGGERESVSNLPKHWSKGSNCIKTKAMLKAVASLGPHVKPSSVSC